jgi:hypothetical protein
MNDLTLYQAQELLDEIESLAEQNGGEIPDDKLALFVEAQTTSIEKTGRLCGAINFLQSYAERCKVEELRIAENRKKAENKLASIKTFLAPIVKAKGKPWNVGTFTLSTRKSESVQIADDFNAPAYMRTIPAKLEPDKAAIKDAIKSGKTIPGAELVEKTNLVIK